MQPKRRQLPPLDRPTVERLALRYVEKFATTRAKLRAYLDRKIRERGFEGRPVDLDALTEKFVERGYVNDRLYAQSKAENMARRGLGARRVQDALRHAGVESGDLDALTEDIEGRAEQSALDFARRRRIGPFARGDLDSETVTKQVAAMIRAGHAPAMAWRVVKMAPEEIPDQFHGG